MDPTKSILKSDLPEVDKLAQAFQKATQVYVVSYQREIELLKALGDEESLVKEQIKLGVMQHARGILSDLYSRITGRQV
jgi:hypothetical protein